MKFKFILFLYHFKLLKLLIILRFLINQVKKAVDTLRHVIVLNRTVNKFIIYFSNLVIYCIIFCFLKIYQVLLILKLLLKIVLFIRGILKWMIIFNGLSSLNFLFFFFRNRSILEDKFRLFASFYISIRFKCGLRR